MAKKVFVSPFREEWKVKTAGTSRAAVICDTKTEAVEKAIQIAKHNKAELFIQNMDGKIGQKNSYGNDPQNIKG